MIFCFRFFFTFFMTLISIFLLNIHFYHFHNFSYNPTLCDVVHVSNITNVTVYNTDHLELFIKESQEYLKVSKEHCVHGKYYNTSIPIVVFHSDIYVGFRILNHSVETINSIIRPTCEQGYKRTIHHEFIFIQYLNAPWREDNYSIKKIEGKDTLCFL